MIYLMDLNMTVLWLAILVVLVVIELLTMGLTTIWFAGGALVAKIASLFGAPLALQVILFLAASALLLYFTCPIPCRLSISLITIA